MLGQLGAGAGTLVHLSSSPMLLTCFLYCCSSSLKGGDKNENASKSYGQARRGVAEPPVGQIPGAVPGVGAGGGDFSCWLFSLQTKLKHKLTVIYSQINGASRALEDVRARQRDVRVSGRAPTASLGPGLGWFHARCRE